VVYAIGNRIRIAREAAGVKQKDLADMIGESQSKLSNWENGLNRPNADQLALIAQALNADGNYLLGLIEDMPYIEAAYEGKLADLPEGERQEIEDYIEFRHQKWLREHGKG